jgi:hypothetical protein
VVPVKCGTLIATFPELGAFVKWENASGKVGRLVFSCDYNGWADVPEDEREAIDAFDAARQPTVIQPVTPVYQAPLYLPPAPLRRAA